MESHLIVAWRPIRRPFRLKQVQMKIDKVGSVKLPADREDCPGVLTALDLHVLSANTTPIDKRVKASGDIVAFKTPIDAERKRLVLEDLFMLDIEFFLKFSKSFDSGNGPLDFEGIKTEISLKVWAFPRTEGEEPFYQLNQQDCEWASILPIDNWPTSIFGRIGMLLGENLSLKWVHSPTNSTIQLGQEDPVPWIGLESIEFKYYFTQVMGMMSTMSGTPFGKLELIEIVLIVVGMWLQKSQSQHARAFQYYNQLKETDDSNQKAVLLQKIRAVFKSSQNCLAPLMFVAIDHVLQSDVPESDKESARSVKRYCDTMALMLEHDQAIYEHLEPFLKELPNLSIAQCLISHFERIKEHLSSLVDQNPPNPEQKAMLETKIQSSYSVYSSPNHSSVWELVLQILEGKESQAQTFYKFSGETHQVKCEDPQALPLVYDKNHLIYYSDYLKVVWLNEDRHVSLDLVSSSRVRFCEVVGDTLIAVQFRVEKAHEFLVSKGNLREILSIPQNSESTFFHYLQKRTKIHKVEDVEIRPNQDIRYHYRSGKLYCVLVSMLPHEGVFLVIIDTRSEVEGSQLIKYQLPEVQFYLGDNPGANLIKMTHRSKGGIFSVCSFQTTGSEHKQQEVHVASYILRSEGNCDLLVDQMLRIDMKMRCFTPRNPDYLGSRFAEAKSRLFLILGVMFGQYQIYCLVGREFVPLPGSSPLSPGSFILPRGFFGLKDAFDSGRCTTYLGAVTQYPQQGKPAEFTVFKMRLQIN